MVCPKCGADNFDGAKACVGCGSPIPAIKNEKNEKKLKIIFSVALIAAVIIIAIVPVVNKYKKYNAAVSAYESGDYETAQSSFYEIVSFEDSLDYFRTIRALPGEVTYYYEGEDPVRTSYEYKFDSHGNPTKSTERSEDLLSFSVFEYEYNEFGNITKMTYRNSDGTEELYVNEYDENGSITREMKTVDGVTEYDTSYAVTYDESGYVTHESATDEIEPGYEADYTYENDTLKSVYFIYEDGITETREYTYDQYGFLIEWKSVKSDGTAYSEKYTYDDQGFMIKEEKINSDGTADITETERDKYGNAVKITYKYAGEDTASCKIDSFIFTAVKY